MREFFALCARSNPHARAVRLDGVLATVNPDVPERSLWNAVIYDDQDALVRALPELAELYERDGVIAWTVWAPAGDAQARVALAAAGHRIDADPSGMAADLEELDHAALAAAATAIAEPIAIDISQVAALNDAAYGLDGAPFQRALAGFPRGAADIHAVALDGLPAAAVLTTDHDGDCGVYAVATVPEARGRGLAGGLMARALLAARERGCTTTTLEATKLGRPVYERLGYRHIGALEMWERRRL